MVMYCPSTLPDGASTPPCKHRRRRSPSRGTAEAEDDGAAPTQPNSGIKVSRPLETPLAPPGRCTPGPKQSNIGSTPRCSQVSLRLVDGVPDGLCVGLAAGSDVDAADCGLRDEVAKMVAEFRSECPARAAAKWCKDTAAFAICVDDATGTRTSGFLVMGRALANAVHFNGPPISAAGRDEAVPEAIPVLQQIWVSPGQRRAGVARSAIRQAVGSSGHVIVEAPVASLARMLEDLGWVLSGSRWASGRSFLCRYYRP